MRTRWKLAILAAALILLAGAVLRGGVTTQPMKEGNSADFWHATCQVQVDPTRTSRCTGETYPPRDGWVVYADKHGEGLPIHGAPERCVPQSKAWADFPAVVRALAAGEHLEDKGHALRSKVIEEGYRAWLAANPERDDAQALLACIRAAWLDHWRNLDRSSPQFRFSTYQFVLAQEKDFDERWENAKRWHDNVIGEFVYLSLLLLFTAWPWLANARPWRWGVHLGVLPLLLFLPYWLGYAPLTFTSAGFRGGPLYPDLILPFRRLPWTSLDGWVLRRFPRILSPYSQSPGSMLAISGLGGVGLVAALALGALLGLLAYTVRARLSSTRPLAHLLPIVSNPTPHRASKEGEKPCTGNACNATAGSPPRIS
jgi:hypothetical protein